MRAHTHTHTHTDTHVDSPFPFRNERTALYKVNGGVGVQELCESGGGRPGLPVPNSPYSVRDRKATLNERS